MFKSRSNVTINNIDLSSRFNRESEFLFIKKVSGRSYIPTSREIIQVPNKAGGFSKPLRLEPRVLEIEYCIKGKSWEDLLKRIEEFNEIVLKDELVSIQFKDEVDRTYYGEVMNISQTDERLKIHEGTLTMVCVDPYKYGTQKTINGLTVFNNGTADTPFDIGMTVTEPSTYLTISDGVNSLGIGKQTSSGQYSETLKLNEPLDALTGWSPITGLFTDYTENGQIISTLSGGSQFYGNYFKLENVTFEGAWIGRSIVKSVGTISDYRAEAVFEVVKIVGDSGVIRQYVLLVDALGKEIGRVGIISGGSNGANRLEVRIGDDASNYKMVDSADQVFTSDESVFCKIILSKKANVYRASVIRVDKNTGVEIKEEISSFYTDLLNLYTEKEMSAVAIHMAESEHQAQGIYDIKVYEYVDENITNPYVVTNGDSVEVDMKNRLIRINGEIRTVNKNILTDYFQLKPGKNILYVSPSVTTDHEVTIRERFL